jgi:hypothetical protein
MIGKYIYTTPMLLQNESKHNDNWIKNNSLQAKILKSYLFLMIFSDCKWEILFGDFNAKIGKEDIFKSTTVDESLHEISNDNGVRVVNLAI